MDAPAEQTIQSWVPRRAAVGCGRGGELGDGAHRARREELDLLRELTHELGDVGGGETGALDERGREREQDLRGRLEAGCTRQTRSERRGSPLARCERHLLASRTAPRSALSMSAIARFRPLRPPSPRIDMSGPLPQGWITERDPSGRSYFV